MTNNIRFLPRARLQNLFDALRAEGYRVAGPRVRDGAIVFGDLAGAEELPRGVRDEQVPGHYRVRDAGGPRCFAWANGPQALKPFLFAPRETLWRVERDARGRLRFQAVDAAPPPLAVIGARACDLAALRMQDKIFLHGPHADPYYAARRSRLFIAAVNCGHPAATCFCASTGDGPRAAQGFDIALSELDEGFVAEAGSAAGEKILTPLCLDAANAAQCVAADEEIARAAHVQTRAVPGRNLRDTLFNNLEHARWDDVAARCLSCGNCTAVCPTCFCHAQHEDARLDGAAAEHVREWDSCFTQGHSHIHGMTIRPDTRARYRQWLTHKFGSWHDQFDTSGCTGCGRCIAWCPAGIDVTEELRAICGVAHE